MKKISVVIPTYNEQDNVSPLYIALKNIFLTRLSEYDHEIIFIDNHSTDLTRVRIEEICRSDKKVKAIFNTKNFGQVRSPVHGFKQASGDCVIRMCADFQDPVELIPDFVAEWENGSKIVIGVKKATKENPFLKLFRFVYYKLLKKIADIDHIENFTGFGLYDSEFVQVIRDLNDPTPYFRGIIAELGYDYKAIPFEKKRRQNGKSKNNFYSLYDYALLGITSYSKIPLRIASIGGFIMSGISLIVALVYFVLKLIYWYRFTAGTAPILIGMFFLGSVQLFFIGLLGEYILSINTRVMNRPLVIEEKRLNFDKEEKVKGFDADENTET